MTVGESVIEIFHKNKKLETSVESSVESVGASRSVKAETETETVSEFNTGTEEKSAETAKVVKTVT